MLDYSITEQTDNKIIHLNGDLDLHLAPELRKLLLQLIKGKNNLVLDLKNVCYLDSSGIACFVEALQNSKKDNLTFHLSNSSAAVLKVLSLARLETVFTLINDED